MAIGKKTGGGSRAGSPNKVTRAIKDMVREAFERAGGADYLVKQSAANPVAFMALIAKLIPTEVSGPDGDAIPISVIEQRIVRPGH